MKKTEVCQDIAQEQVVMQSRKLQIADLNMLMAIGQLLIMVIVKIQLRKFVLMSYVHNQLLILLFYLQSTKLYQVQLMHMQ